MDPCTQQRVLSLLNFHQEVTGLSFTAVACVNVCFITL